MQYQTSLSILWPAVTCPIKTGPFGKFRATSGDREKPLLLSTQAFYLATVWYFLHWWDTMTGVRVLRSNDCNLLHLIAADGRHVVRERAPVLILKFFFGIIQSSVQLRCFRLWGKNGGPASDFVFVLLGIWIMTLWLAEVAGWLAAWNSDCGLISPSLPRSTIRLGCTAVSVAMGAVRWNLVSYDIWHPA